MKDHIWGTCTCGERHDGHNEPDGFHIGMVTFKPGFSYPLTCECGRVIDERVETAYLFKSKWIGRMRLSRYHLTEEEIKRREPEAEIAYESSRTQVFTPGYLNAPGHGHNMCGRHRTPRADEE